MVLSGGGGGGVVVRGGGGLCVARILTTAWIAAAAVGCGITVMGMGTTTCLYSIRAMVVCAAVAGAAIGCGGGTVVLMGGSRLTPATTAA